MLRDRFALVAYGPDPARLLEAMADPLLDQLGAVRVGIVPASQPCLEADGDVHILRDGSGAVAAYFAGTGDSLALLRPDRYVMAVTSAAEARPVLDALRTLIRATGDPVPRSSPLSAAVST